MEFDTEQFVRDRDSAFTRAVVDDDWSAVYKYLNKYGMERPSSRKVLRAAIYKAVQHCTNIPQDVKDIAVTKCIELGFSPLIQMGGADNG